MDLFDKQKEVNKEEEGSLHEQMALEFDLPAQETLNTEKEEAPAKVKKKSPAKKNPPKDVLNQESINPESASLGKYLQDMRVQNDYTIVQVEQITKIQSRYIELLEMDKLRKELPPFYVLAYIRKLCTCYRVPADKAATIMSELKTELESAVSPELIENINIDHEIDEDNQKKLRHFAWLLAGAIVFFILLVGLAIFMLSSPLSPKGATRTNLPIVAGEKFDQEKLRFLQAPVIIEATELPAQ